MAPGSLISVYLTARSVSAYACDGRWAFTIFIFAFDLSIPPVKQRIRKSGLKKTGL